MMRLELAFWHMIQLAHDLTVNAQWPGAVGFIPIGFSSFGEHAVAALESGME
jgi:hypothetical protein